MQRRWPNSRAQKLRAKRDALAQAVVGRLQERHVFLLREQLAHLDDLDAAIARLDAELAARLAAAQEALALVQTIPGVARRTAEVLVAQDRRRPLALPLG
jgi:transposase